MQIQKINFLSNKKGYQKDKNNNKPSILILASMPRKHISRNDDASILIASSKGIAERIDDKINHYLNSSKKELKDIQKIAKAHRKQCLGILKKAEKTGYTSTINCDDYNITFGVIDPKTNKPSIINIWEDGKMVQQYKINSLEPLNIEVYDCELKNFDEEFYMLDNNLTTYKSHNKANNIVTLIVPKIYGFYRVEGQFDERTNSIKKSIELQYINSRKYPSTYSEYGENGAHHYQSDALTGSWYLKNLNRPDTLSLNS